MRLMSLASCVSYTGNYSGKVTPKIFVNTTNLHSFSFRVVTISRLIIMFYHKICPVWLLIWRPSLQGEVRGGHD